MFVSWFSSFKICIFAFIRLRIMTKSSVIFNLLISHTIPEMLKNLSMNELVAEIFKRTSCSWKRVIVKEEGNILVNELRAALLSLQLAKQKATEAGPLFAARLYIDNKALVALVNRGRVKWSEDTISIFQKFNFLKKIELIKEQFPVRAVYIPTAANPADALSRMPGGPGWPALRAGFSGARYNVNLYMHHCSERVRWRAKCSTLFFLYICV